MNQPISRKEFVAANEKMIKSIKGHIDEKFSSHEKLEKLMHEATNKVLNDHHVVLYGDPGDEKSVGLRIKVDRLNQLVKRVSLATGTVIATVGGWIGLK